VTPSCTNPEILCNVKCVNPDTDPKNCGGCGIDCGLGRTCNSGKCDPSWVPTAAAGGPSARSHAAYAALTNPGRVFVWGGQTSSGDELSTGAIYDVSTNSWSPVAADSSTPSKRVLAAAAWTGDSVFVWGGGSASADYADGALYNPSTNGWKSVTTTGAPSARRAPSVTWTGSRVLLWGGFDKANQPVGGVHLYDPLTDVWTAASTTNAPSPRLDSTAGWNGTDLFLYGGQQGNTDLDEMLGYDVSTDTWSVLTKGPSPRHAAFGGWDGSVFVAWGGRKQVGTVTLSDGRRYNSNNDSWNNISAGNEPTARYASWRVTGWSARISSGRTLLMGGRDAADQVVKGGAIYTSTSNGWTSVPTWPSAEDHLYGVGAWAGGEFVIWGGINGSTATATGERFRP